MQKQRLNERQVPPGPICRRCSNEIDATLSLSIKVDFRSDNRSDCAWTGIQQPINTVDRNALLYTQPTYTYTYSNTDEYTVHLKIRSCDAIKLVIEIHFVISVIKTIAI